MIKALRNPENRFLLSLLIVDVAFIVLHCLKYSTGLVSFYLFDIDENRGYAEIYQAIKEFWIVITLLFFALKRRKAIYWFWIILFSFMLLGDVIVFHEHVAGYLTNNLFAAHELRKIRVKLGEMVVYAAIGIPLLLSMCAVHKRSTHEERVISSRLAQLFFMLMVFAVLVDLVYFSVQLFADWDVLLFVLATVEESGEMVLVSVIYAFLFNLNLKENAQKYRLP